jgi:hypothetical protein
MARRINKHDPMNMHPRGASLETLVKRIRFGGRKGRSATRRLWPWAPVDTWEDVTGTWTGSVQHKSEDKS